jgi:micrococcal nuclease
MRLKYIIIILLISISAAAGEKAVVKKIFDGDTIAVISCGKYVKVRLIGIDTPENRENEKTLRDSGRSGKDVKIIISQGKQATAFVKSVLRKGDTITLEFDIEKHDKYGRTLAYVYLSDGRMLNDIIISSGYASPLTIAPNTKYKNRFLQSFQTARDKKIGLWSEK